MKEIPCFIEADIENPVQSKIPRNIIQTFKNNMLHESIYDNIITFLDKNKDYNYYLITDEIGIQLITEHFDLNTLEAFHKLNLGAAKGDFLRYIAMYVYGGVYIDLDSTIKTSLSHIVDPNIEHLVFIDKYFNLEQWIFMFSKKNVILLQIIHEMVQRIHNRETNIFIATGPTLFTDVFINMIRNSRCYNTYFTMTLNNRRKVLSENDTFMNGKMEFIKDNTIKKHFANVFDGYSNDKMYEDNDKYIITFNSPTPNFYKQT